MQVETDVEVDTDGGPSIRSSTNKYNQTFTLHKFAQKLKIKRIK